MKTVNKKLATVAIIALALPSAALAEGFYGSAQIGYSAQASDSAPYGTNIAVDPDFPRSEFDAEGGLTGAIGLGYRFNENFRLEGRLSHRSSDFNNGQPGTGGNEGYEYIVDGDISSTAFTIEGFYDFPNSTAFTPYVKAGIGVSRNKYSARLTGSGITTPRAEFGSRAIDSFDNANGNLDGYYTGYDSNHSTDFTWNVGFGGSYEVSKNTTLFAEYQYGQFGDVKTSLDPFGDGFKIDNVSSHEVSVGIRVNF